MSLWSEPVGPHCSVSLWSEPVGPHCSVSLWSEPVGPHCSVSLWSKHVGPHCSVSLWSEPVEPDIECELAILNVNQHSCFKVIGNLSGVDIMLIVEIVCHLIIC